MATERPAQPETPPPQRGILCPYCGSVSSSDPKRCDRCGGFFDPLSRQATQNAMGPWLVRDAANPFRPGCSYETIRDLIRRGKVHAQTVLRGPSTKQYWNFASRTPGIANLLGLCHNCQGPAKPEDYSCAKCGAVFTPDTDRQHLGLAPVHLLPGQAPPAIIASVAVDRAGRREIPPTRPVLPLAPPRAPAGASPALKAAAIVLVILIGLGIVVAGLLRFVVPTYVVTHTYVVPDESVAPVKVDPPAPAVPAPEPEPATPEPARPTETPDAQFGRLRTMLLATPLDADALIQEASRLKVAHPASAAEADEIIELARQRQERERLRSLPRP